MALYRGNYRNQQHKVPLRHFLCLFECFLALFGRKLSHVFAAVYLGYGKRDPCHGRHFKGGAKIACQKLNLWFTVSWTSILRPIQPFIQKLQQHRALI